MLKVTVLVVLLLVHQVAAQQACSQTQEQHLALSFEECTNSGGCTTKQGSVTLDSNWRWLHELQGTTNCYTGNSWNQNDCPDDQTCAQKCCLDGVDDNTWTGTYGVTASGSSLKLDFVTQGPYSKNIGSRLYLLDDNYDYFTFHLRNREFTFDVDVSNLPCGINGALYFSEMMRDGGSQEFSTNKAGAKYGTGYCDAQCPHDLKFINGLGNAEGWVPSKTDVNSGTGKYGTCCAEMDIWEANETS